MIKTFHKVLYIILIPVLLTSCWDYRDIDKRSIVLSIGVDKVNEQIEFTGEVAKLPSGQRRFKISDAYSYWSLGKYFEGSKAHFDARITNPDFSGAIRAVVFSQEYAKTEGIESYINRFYYIPQFRNAVLTAISKEPTSEFYNGRVENDISIGHAVENTIRSLGDNGRALYRTLQQIKADIEFKDIGYFIPYITRNGATIEYIGLAAMNHSKLIGIVQREESNGVLFILANKPIAVIAIPHPADKENLVSTKNSLKKRSIKTEYRDDKVNININLEIDSQIQYLYDIETTINKDIKKLEDTISNQIKKDIMSVVELSQKQYKYDVFGFAKYFRADNIKEYKKINWVKEYPLAKINVNVQTTITNTNLLDADPKMEVR